MSVATVSNNRKRLRAMIVVFGQKRTIFQVSCTYFFVTKFSLKLLREHLGLSCSINQSICSITSSLSDNNIATLGSNLDSESKLSSDESQSGI